MEPESAKVSSVDVAGKPTSFANSPSKVEPANATTTESRGDGHESRARSRGGKLRTLEDDPLNAELNESMMAESRDPVRADEAPRDVRESGEGANPEEALSTEDVLRELRKLENVDESRKLSIFTCHNVQLFYIDPSGEVSSNTESSKLTIFKVEGDVTETIFLEVGTWVYPLFTNISPWYRSEQGIYMFPDIYAETEGATVGLMLPEEESKALLEVLIDILDTKDAARNRRSTGGTAIYLSDKLSRGSSYLSQNIIRASSSIAGYLDSATSTIANRMQPQAQATISPNVEKAAHVAEKVSGSALTASHYLTSNLGQAVTAMGRFITPYVPNVMRQVVPEEAAHVACSTLQGIGTIYNGLEESVEILARSLSNNAVKLVGHRYGPSAGHVTRDVLSTVGNIYAARRNVNFLRPKSLAKTTLRSAGQAFLEERRNKL